jgi:hypothetical protein
MSGKVTCIGLTAIGVMLLAACGCSSSSKDEPTTTTTGGSSSASGGSTSASGGATASGGSPATSTGGSPATDTGGSPATDSGGSPATDSGGSPATDSGGSPATDSGGASSTGGAGTTVFSPLCADYLTAAGVAPTKGGACVAADVQLCYKTCGPNSIGFKTETCTGGVYVEGGTCQYDPAGDYSCYKLPDTAPADCPATAPQATMACTLATCTVCGGTATAQTTGYLDSSSAAKVGYCVCTASSKWTCATALTAWPCPGNPGC